MSVLFLAMKSHLNYVAFATNKAFHILFYLKFI